MDSTAVIALCIGIYLVVGVLMVQLLGNIYLAADYDRPSEFLKDYFGAIVLWLPVLLIKAALEVSLFVVGYKFFKKDES